MLSGSNGPKYSIKVLAQRGGIDLRFFGSSSRSTLRSLT